MRSTGAPPNWRPILFGASDATAGPQAIYRAAAPSLALPDELAACPANVTWLDLRTAPERELDTRAPDWAVVHLPLAEADPKAAAASAEKVLTALLDGRLSFGDLYVRMLAEWPARFAQVIEAVDAVQGPVVLACQGGRDRTGTLVAVLLDLVGLDRAQIVADYLRTNDDQDETVRRQPDSPGERLLVGYDMTCRASDIGQVLDHLHSAGGARAYLAPHLRGDVDALAGRLRERILHAT